jgi:glycine/D-amino acid oxidase-like deaminating enzyme/nitrite reductase/ring-hydroxylating ferredoxin subunit
LEAKTMTDESTPEGAPSGESSLGEKTPTTTPLPVPNVNGLEADVVIIGAGITGLTAGLTLKRAGRRVVLLDAQRGKNNESCRTTAHLTEVMDTHFATLLRRFGFEDTQLLIEGHRHAIGQIERWAREMAPNCGFQRLPGYLFAARGDRAQLQTLEAETAAISRLGYGDIAMDSIPGPFPVAGALRFDRQAQLRPSAYLAALESHIHGNGSLVVRGIRARSIEDDGGPRPVRIATNGGDVFAGRVVVATHVPIGDHLSVHADLTAHRSYAVAARFRPELSFAALLWDLGTPYHYFRTVRMGNGDFLIVGGGDHPVGDAIDTEQVLRDLVSHARKHFGPVEITHRWSGQIIETADGMPYVGEDSTASRVSFATGFSGNGFTGGTLAGLVLADAIRGRENRWARLLAPTRALPLASLGRRVRRNLTAVKRLAGRLKEPARRVEDLPPRAGMVTGRYGDKLAVYRNDAGVLFALSAVCPHRGGHVEWNRAERSWDCPSCGSRFAVTGEVLNGPAENDLALRYLAESEKPAMAAPVAQAG